MESETLYGSEILSSLQPEQDEIEQLLTSARAPSSVLAALGTLQLGALGLLLRGDFMDSLPNYYIMLYWRCDRAGDCEDNSDEV